MQYIDAEDMTLRIVGDGDLRDNLEELVTELGINNRVEFTGFVDRAEIPHMLSSAMIGIAPIKSDSSLQYAIPTKLYEYMASGLAVVAVGTGEIEQFVSDADAGYVADNDPRDIASKIDSLFINSTKRNQFGTNGYLYVREQYDRKAIAAQFNEHLRDHLRSQTEQDDQ
jgi:glycosyltransferase involved in cell wall biosynthesis